MRRSRFRPVWNGVVFGGVAVWLMVARIQIGDGAFMDARGVPIALIGLFEGPAAAAISALPPLLYRLWLGGPGAPVGAAGLLAVAAVAAAAHLWAQRSGGVRWRHGTTLGAAVFVLTWASFALLGSRELHKFSQLWPGYFAVYVVGLTLLTRLFRDAGDRARLATERERFRAIIDEASDAIRIVDVETMRIVDANLAECRLTGYDRADLIGRDARMLWPFDATERQEHEALDAEARGTAYAQRFGLACRTRTGALTRVDVTARVVTHGDRRWEIVVRRDAADREAAEAAQREAAELRAVNLLARGTAHEINNPLAVVMGGLDLLARQLPEEGRERKIIDRTLDASRRIRDIVARLTQIRRLEKDEGHSSLPPILDLKRSSEPPAGERTGDDRWTPSSTPSSS